MAAPLALVKPPTMLTLNTAPVDGMPSTPSDTCAMIKLASVASSSVMVALATEVLIPPTLTLLIVATKVSTLSITSSSKTGRVITASLASLAILKLVTVV